MHTNIVCMYTKMVGYWKSFWKTCVAIASNLRKANSIQYFHIKPSNLQHIHMGAPETTHFNIL